jgi:hypothetical protein
VSPPTLAELRGRLAGLRGRPRVRRARAALRLHRRLLLALLVGAGILSMVIHWA